MEKLAGSDFTSEPSCGAGYGNPDDMSHEFFFWNDYTQSSILSQFSWSIQPEPSEDDFLALAGGQVDDCFSAGSSALRCEDISSCSFEPGVVSAPLVSSSSSDDLPEKSTASGDSSGVAAGSPLNIARKTTKKKGQRRIRQQSFAFATKSVIDRLEDGYRWRKYGQKIIKDSPNPRSYYRCTNSTCTVKKRIERSSKDPSFVITTYEGRHCHVSAQYPAFSFARYLTPYTSPLYNPRSANILKESSRQIIQFPPRIQGKGGECKTVQELSSQTLVGEGLLGDIVAPGMRNG